MEEIINLGEIIKNQIDQLDSVNPNTFQLLEILGRLNKRIDLLANELQKRDGKV